MRVYASVSLRMRFPLHLLTTSTPRSSSHLLPSDPSPSSPPSPSPSMSMSDSERSSYESEWLRCTNPSMSLMKSESASPSPSPWPSPSPENREIGGSWGTSKGLLSTLVVHGFQDGPSPSPSPSPSAPSFLAVVPVKTSLTRVLPRTEADARTRTLGAFGRQTAHLCLRTPSSRVPADPALPGDRDKRAASTASLSPVPAPPWHRPCRPFDPPKAAASLTCLQAARHRKD